jgi:restriction system protein
LFEPKELNASEVIRQDDRVTAPRIPQYHELMWPALQATKDLSGSATVSEMNERTMAAAGVTEDQQAVPHGEDGRMSEVEYRLHWARTHLKGIGALENSARGVWTVTDRGRSMTEPEMQVTTKAWRDSLRERRLARRDTHPTEAEGEEEEAEGGWKDQLIARLLQLPPDGFERLAQRILREAGFVNVTVTGKSGDGGIDGTGTYRLSLVSFPVYFQCKRYKGAVSAGAVRDFRGAMAGRGEKGLLITTGSFTREAQAEATRDGAPPVELIDGDRLCDLLKEFRLGIEVRQRIAEDVTVDRGFFNEYQ